jgi:hypothetical protein
MSVTANTALSVGRTVNQLQGRPCTRPLGLWSSRKCHLPPSGWRSRSDERSKPDNKRLNSLGFAASTGRREPH